MFIPMLALVLILPIGAAIGSLIHDAGENPQSQPITQEQGENKR